MDNDNQELHMFCEDWGYWHRSRRLFAPPVPQNILARMRPQPVRESPDAILSADLSYFNLAVLSQPEGTGKQAFYMFYLYRASNIKVAAEHIGVSRNTFYKTLKTFRARAYRSYRAMMEGKTVVEEEEAVTA